MNPEQISQVIETIKTLNINFNDATTQKIADAIIPIVKMYLIKEYIYMGMNFLVILLVAFTLYKIVGLIIKSNKNDRNSNN